MPEVAPIVNVSLALCISTAPLPKVSVGAGALRFQELVLASESELRSHMMKEEQILFPYIRSMEASGQNGVSNPQGNKAWVQQPIHVMEMEHETVGNNFAAIRELTSGYALPQDACTTYQLLFKLLEEFEDDLHLHIHLENNILFPKAIAMEKELMKAAKSL